MRVLFLLISLLFSQSIFSTDYYVSNTGDDNVSGHTELSAWKSIGKVNEAIKNGLIKNGDRILFRRGDLFHGHLLIKDITNVTFMAYGEGSPPVLSGTKTISSWNLYTGNIWYAVDNTLPANVRQLIMNGAHQNFGRWPDRNSRPEKASHWREYNNPHDNNQFNDKEGLSVPDNYWKGAEAVIGITEYGYILENFKIDRQIGSTFYFTSDSYQIYTGANHYYYIQNHVNTLNINGEWAYKQDSVFLYSTSAPDNLNINVSNVETNTEIQNSSDITIEGLNISDANYINVLILNSNRINFNSCTISNGAYDGLHIENCDSVVLQYTVIKDIANNGVQISDSEKVHFLDNKLSNIGLDRGAGGGGNGKSTGIRIKSGKDYYFKNNEIYNIGYNGITLINYKTFNCLITNNYVHHYCMTKADGGGIYTWQLNNNHNNGNVIDKNIIAFGEEGIDLGMSLNNDGRTFPIYCDDRTDYITVSNNTCVGGIFSIYLHSASNMNIKGNTLYQGNYSLIGLKDQNENIEMINNTFFNNKLIYNNNTGRGFYFNNMSNELNSKSVTSSNDYIIDIFHIRSELYAAGGHNSGPLMPNGRMFFSDWEKLDFTHDAKCISKEIITEQEEEIGAHLFFKYNPTKKDSTIYLADTIYIDTEKDTVGNFITIKPYESVFLVKIGTDSCYMTVTPSIENDINNSGIGSISLDVYGAVPPYDYLWSKPSGAVGNQVKNLTSGIYSCLITSANNCVTSRSFEVTNKGNVQIINYFPNPTNAKVELIFYSSHETNIFLTVINQTGLQVMKHELAATKGNNRAIIDMGSLASGSYVFVITDGSSSDSSVIIKQK